MQGVEILDTVVIYSRAISMLAFWICFGIIFLLGTAFSIYLATKEYNSEYLLFALLFLMLAAIGGVICGTIFGEDYVSDIQYKVTVDETANMNEFFEKYEVIDAEGKILVVREWE